MKVVCDSCGAVYKIADDKLVKEVNKATCKRCGHKIIIRKGVGSVPGPAEAGEGRTQVGPPPTFGSAPTDERTVITTIPELQRFEGGAAGPGSPIGSLTSELRAIVEPTGPTGRGAAEIGPAASAQMPAAMSGLFRAQQAPTLHSSPVPPPGAASQAFAVPSSLTSPSTTAPWGAPAVPPWTPPAAHPGPMPTRPAGPFVDPNASADSAAGPPLFDSSAYTGDVQHQVVIGDGSGGPAAHEHAVPDHGANGVGYSAAPSLSVPPVAAPAPQPALPMGPVVPAAAYSTQSVAIPPGLAAASMTSTMTIPARVAPHVSAEYTLFLVYGLMATCGVGASVIGPRIHPALGLLGTGMILVAATGTTVQALFSDRGKGSRSAVMMSLLLALFLGGAATAGIWAMTQQIAGPTGAVESLPELDLPPPAPVAAAPEAAPGVPPVDPTLAAAAPEIPSETADAASAAAAVSTPPAPVAGGRTGTPSASESARASNPEPAPRAEPQPVAAAAPPRTERTAAPPPEVAPAAASTDPARANLRPASEVLTNVVVDTIVSSNKAIRQCFIEAKDRGTDLSGKIKVQFHVQPDGKVRKAKITNAEYAGTDLDACVSGAVNRLAFPAFSDEKDRAIIYPFIVR